MPSAASTYMSAGSIRSFCTPAPLPYLFNSPMSQAIEPDYSVQDNMPPSFIKHAIRSYEMTKFQRFVIWRKLKRLDKGFTSSWASITYLLPCGLSNSSFLPCSTSILRASKVTLRTHEIEQSKASSLQSAMLSTLKIISNPVTRQ